MIKTQSQIVEEKEFVEIVTKLEEKDVVCHTQPTKSGPASYNILYCKVNDKNVKLILHLKNVKMSFRATRSENRDGTMSPHKLKASFAFDPKNLVHLAIKKIDELAEKAALPVLGKQKIYNGCIQKTAKNTNGCGDVDVDPRIWVNMQPKDRQTLIECAACPIIISVNDGKKVKQEIKENMRVQDLISEYGYSYMVSECYVSFDNFITVNSDVRHPLSFVSFKPISLIPLKKDNSQEIEEMKRKAMEYIKAENIINNGTAVPEENNEESTATEKTEEFDVNGNVDY